MTGNRWTNDPTTPAEALAALNPHLTPDEAADVIDRAARALQPTVVDVVAAAIKLREALRGDHPAHDAMLRSMRSHLPDVAEAIDAVVASVNPPPPDVARMLHPSNNVVTDHGASLVDELERRVRDHRAGAQAAIRRNLGPIEAFGGVRAHTVHGLAPEVWADDVGHVHPHHYPDPEGDAA